MTHAMLMFDLHKAAKENGSVVDETVRVYGEVAKLQIGRNVRIDAFAVITAGPEGVWIGDDVHVGAGAMIFGAGGKVTVGDGCSLSPRSTVYTSCDDFRLAGLVGPQNPAERRNVISGPVTMEEGSALGHGAVLLPGTVLRKGAAVATYVVLAGCEIGPGTYVGHGVREERR